MIKNKKIGFIKFILLSAGLFFISYDFSLAQTTRSITFSNPLQSTQLQQVVDAIATVLFNFALPIAVIVIIYSGITFLLSRGNQEQVARAKRILLYGVIGLVIILIGRGFVALINSVLTL